MGTCGLSSSSMQKGPSLPLVQTNCMILHPPRMGVLSGGARAVREASKHTDQLAWRASELIIGEFRPEGPAKSGIVHDSARYPLVPDCSKNDPTSRCRAKCNDKYSACLRD